VHDELLVHDLVALRAAANPGALAISARDAELTFGDLEQRSSQFAHRLKRTGVSLETPVGLCMERSATLVVGALGILKAGGAYVALDPAFPQQRLEFMLRDSGAAVLVTSPALAERFISAGRSVVALDPEWTALDDQPDTPLRTRAGHRSLAYVVYTSGSTGSPKGVMLEHQGLLNLVRWHHRAFSIGDLDRCTQIASPGFDACAWELWAALTAGSSVHIPTDEVRAQPKALRDWLVATRVTVSFLPTPVAEEVMVLDWPEETALRYLLTGGDALKRYPEPHLPFMVVNNYGPAEATVVATSGVVAPSAGAPRAPSLGKPIDNVSVTVVDEYLRSVAPGVAGELLIGGAGVGRGYMNQPQLTAEKFLPDPSSAVTGARLYRTGDLVRVRTDGDIEFLGRIDDQVEIRGCRIELGEVAANLNSHPSVRSSVVAVDERGPGEKRLVAYVASRDGIRCDPESLSAHLIQRLPDYMLPAVYVWLDEIPLTVNGKVDRAALPPPDRVDASDRAADPQPRTDLEQVLAGMVADLLMLECVGVEENFFMLGGHSLLGAQLITRIADRFGVELALRTLFDHATVVGMAREVERLMVADLEAMSDEEAELMAGNPHGDLRRSA
jgi:amino acid adenylation domain-containing protein